MRLGAFPGIEVVADLDEVSVRSPEFSGSDSNTSDDHGEDEAEDRDLTVTESSLDLSRSLSSQTLVYHLSGLGSNPKQCRT